MADEDELTFKTEFKFSQGSDLQSLFKRGIEMQLKADALEYIGRRLNFFGLETVTSVKDGKVCKFALEESIDDNGRVIENQQTYYSLVRLCMVVSADVKFSPNTGNTSIIFRDNIRQEFIEKVRNALLKKKGAAPPPGISLSGFSVDIDNVPRTYHSEVNRRYYVTVNAYATPSSCVRRPIKMSDGDMAIAGYEIPILYSVNK
jgi:hypothetical protein